MSKLITYPVFDTFSFHGADSSLITTLIYCESGKTINIELSETVWSILNVKNDTTVFRIKFFSSDGVEYKTLCSFIKGNTNNLKSVYTYTPQVSGYFEVLFRGDQGTIVLLKYEDVTIDVSLSYSINKISCVQNYFSLIDRLEIGSVDYEDGKEIVQQNRVRTIGIVNTPISIKCNSNYGIKIVLKYDKDSSYIGYQSINNSSYATNTREYVRVVFYKLDNSDFSENELSQIIDSSQTKMSYDVLWEYAFDSSNNSKTAIQLASAASNPLFSIMNGTTCYNGIESSDNRRKSTFYPIYGLFSITMKSGYLVRFVNYYDREGNFVSMITPNSTSFVNNSGYGARITFSATNLEQNITSIDFYDEMLNDFSDGATIVRNQSLCRYDASSIIDASINTSVIVTNIYKPKNWGGVLWSDGYVWRWNRDNTLFTVAENFQTIKLSDSSVYDASTLNQKNQSVRFHCLSIAKAMTCLLADELIADWTQSVECLEMDLTSGDYYTLGDITSLNDLIYDAMLPSDNSAAKAIGRMCGRTITPTGTPQEMYNAHIQLMNSKAAEIGMINTTYDSAAGGSYSTPEDQCKLLNYIYLNAPRLMNIWGELTHVITITGGPNPRTFTVTSTTSQSIRTNIIPEFIGGKTGSGDATMGNYICLWRNAHNNELYGTCVMNVDGTANRMKDVRRLIDDVYYEH